MKRIFTLLIALGCMFTSLSATTIADNDFFTTVFREEGLKVFPNPATNVVTIEYQSVDQIQPEIKIIDLTGKVVLKSEEEMTSAHDVYRLTLDVSDLNQGVYFVKIIQGKKAETKKLLIK